MKQALFKVGEQAFHIGVQKWGRVVCCFEEVPGQYRYYVRFNFQNWSVPEWALDSKEVQNPQQEKQVLTHSKFWKKPGKGFPPAS